MTKKGFVLIEDNIPIATIVAGSIWTAVESLGAKPESRLVGNPINARISFFFEKINSNPKMWRKYTDEKKIFFRRIDKSGVEKEPALIITFQRDITDPNKPATTKRTYLLKKVCCLISAN